MMIYRSLVVGLLGAIALLLAQQGHAHDRLDRTLAAGCAERADLPERAVTVTISRAGAGEDPTPALGLGEDDVVTAIDDAPVDRGWRAAVLDRWRASAAGEYFELRVWSPAARSRMLVLVTP